MIIFDLDGTLIDSSIGIYNAYLNISSNASQSESFLIELISSTTSLAGDLNDDGVNNVLDVILMVNIVLGLEPFNNSADMNNDGSVNVLDVVILVNIILEG